MQLDVQLSDHLTESEFFTKNPHVINLEDSLLDLASSNALDGIFYFCSNHGMWQKIFNVVPLPDSFGVKGMTL